VTEGRATSKVKGIASGAKEALFSDDDDDSGDSDDKQGPRELVVE
jgi:hypothetical protein